MAASRGRSTGCATFLGVSVTPVTTCGCPLAGFVVFYSALAVVDVYLLCA